MSNEATNAHEATQVFAEGATPEHEKKEEGVKVFVGNLAFSTTDEGLKAFFAPVADDITAATIVHRYGRSSGYGFVTVKTAEAAQKAVQELDKQQLEGREIIVEVAKTTEAREATRKERQPFNKRKQSRRGSKAVQGEVSEAEANGHAAAAAPARIDDAGATSEGAEGRPKRKKAPKKKKAKTPAEGAGAPNGVEEATEKMEKLDVNGTTEHKERPPRKRRVPREPRPKRDPGEQPAGEPSKSVLFVANLAFSVDEAQLTEFFTNAGVNVRTARVVRRRWGTPRKSKGYGFVDVGDEAEQQKAIELTNGKTIDEREISVKVAVDAKHIDDAVGKAEEGEPTMPIVPVA